MRMSALPAEPFDHEAYRAQWLPEQWAEWTLGTSIKSGPQVGTGRTLIYDAEGDGILHASGSKKAVTQFWCIAAIDVDTLEEFYWGVDLGPQSLEQGIRFLEQAACLIGHFAIHYDYPATKRLYPWWNPKGKLWDSMTLAKVVWPAESLIAPDLKRIRAGQMPGHLMKAHSLKAWGYRTGTHKGEYTGGFDMWCPSMAVYLMGDVRGTLALWNLIKKRIGWSNPAPGQLVWDELTLEMECEVDRIIFEQEEYGVRFDVPKAIALAAHLKNEQARIGDALIRVFGTWWQPIDDPSVGRVAGGTMQRKLTEHPDITKPRYGKRGARLADYVGPPLEDISEGSASVRVELTEFNPASRAHVAQRLQAVFGWKPKAFGKDGVPTVDEGTLEEIPDAVMPAETRQLLLDYFVVSKTLGTLSKGARSWLNMVKDDGRIHGQMDTCGAVTRRGTHKNPNLSGTPSVTMEKDGDGVEHPVKGLPGRYGWECRELFCADEGWEQTGSDASSLELILLGHYLHPLDGGAFSQRVCDPARDPHREHAGLMGGGTLRSEAKTCIYLKVYGGSAYKHSLSLSVAPHEVPQLLNYKGLSAILKGLERRFDADFVLKLDDNQKARISKARQQLVRLEKGIEGLKKLIENISAVASEKGWLKAIDGSRIIVRKAHAALNAILQSAGAIACKYWMVLVHRELKRLGLIIGKDFKQILWVHDELQFTHRPGLGPLIAEVCERCLVEVGVRLGLRGRFRTGSKTGLNWADCH